MCIRDRGNFAQNLHNKISGRLAGTDARDGAVVLAQVVGDLDGIVLDGDVEIVERQDQQRVDERISQPVVVEPCLLYTSRCV